MAEQHEFLASSTFPKVEGADKDEQKWHFERSEVHGGIVLHWFSSLFPFSQSHSKAIGIVASDQNNHWLGSSWSCIGDFSEKKYAIRDLASAKVLSDALKDVEETFVRSHSGLFGVLKIFWGFMCGGKEKKEELARAVVLCELRNKALAEIASPAALKRGLKEYDLPEAKGGKEG